MKIVIDLPDSDYQVMLTQIMLSCRGCKITELPSGHGGLIYSKDAIETLQIMFARDKDIQNACEQCILDCPTIIEADTAESEDNG